MTHSSINTGLIKTKCILIFKKKMKSGGIAVLESRFAEQEVGSKKWLRNLDFETFILKG